MVHFSPISAALGGVLIGIGLGILLLVHGRVAGISGILGGLISPSRHDIAWRMAFLIGLLLGGAILSQTAPQLLTFELQRTTPVIILAGLLVGFGTRLGSGCTSGHGVCGLSRFSIRALVATLTFMIVGALTVFAINPYLGGGR